MLSIALAVALASPIAADASSTASLQAGVRAALRAAKSFVVHAKINPYVHAPLGATFDWTVVAPNRYHQVSHGDPTGDDDTIIIGHEVYGHKHGSWDVQTWDDNLVNGFEDEVFGVTIVSGGNGTYVAKAPLGPQDSTMTCTYDEKTLRPLQCRNDLITLTYSRYDDPSVTIPTPAHAVRID
jgi:hypothetical protein